MARPPPLKQSERILSLEHQLLQTLNGFLKNGARPSSLIRMDKRPTAEDAQRFREQFRDEYSGSTNTGKPLVMWGEFDYHQLGESLLDDNVLAFLEYTRQAIMAVYKVPPLILASNDGQTWATSREQRKSFYTEAVIPLATLVLDTLNASPLVRSFGGGVYLAADYSGVEALQPDRVAQAQADHIYVTDGTRTINEIREVREFGEPKEWGDKPVPSPLAYAYGINPFEYDVDEQLAPSAPAGDEAQAFAREIARAKAIGDKGEERALRWKRFVRQTQPIERAWTRALSPLFADMRDEVMGTLDSLAGGTKASAGNGIQTKAADDPVPMGWTAAEWFNLMEALGVWEADLQNVAERTMQTGAEDILKEITGMFVPFDVDRPEVQDFINTRMATQIKTILESRQKDIVRAVTAAAETGQTIGELEKELRRMFDKDSKVWSLRIARTETAGLYNAGAQSGMEEAGVETKEWLSARDSDVRTSHKPPPEGIDGQTVPIGEDFRFPNGAHGPYPGQINSAEENINCRCTTIPGDV